jgi:hypothetical protein
MKNLVLYLRDNDGVLIKYPLSEIREVLIAEVLEKDESHEKETILKSITLSEL